MVYIARTGRSFVAGEKHSAVMKGPLRCLRRAHLSGRSSSEMQATKQITRDSAPVDLHRECFIAEVSFFKMGRANFSLNLKNNSFSCLISACSF